MAASGEAREPSLEALQSQQPGRRLDRLAWPEVWSTDNRAGDRLSSLFTPQAFRPFAIVDARQQPDGPVLLMSANAGYMYLVENWVRHAVQRGLNLSEPTMILTENLSNQRPTCGTVVSTHNHQLDRATTSSARPVYTNAWPTAYA